MNERLFSTKRLIVYTIALLLAAVTLSVGAVIDVQRQQWRATVGPQARADEQARDRAQNTLWRLTASLPERKHPTLRDAEVALNGGEPFARSEGEHLYHDSATGGEALLRVRKDRWFDVVPLVRRPIRLPAYWDSFDLGRALIAIPGHFLGLLYLIVVLMDWRAKNRRGRIRAATDLLVISIAVSIITCAGPGLWRNVGSLAGNNPGAWSAGGALVSLLLLGTMWLRRKEGPSDPACLNCGYNLIGNLSGRCPECGTALTPEQVATVS